MVVSPRMPQEVIDEILCRLAVDSDPNSLKSCTLVSKSWATSCRRHLFHAVTFTLRNMNRWLEAFPVPEESPAHLVRDLGFQVGGGDYAPENFLEHIPWFTNVERVSLLAQQGRPRPLWISQYWRLPQSATSLTISADAIPLALILNVMARLPNLDDLSLSGMYLLNSPLPQVAGAHLKGRFGGSLRLAGGPADKGVMDALLEIPTGLRFTEVDIRCMRNCFLSTVRLVEACSKTLVKFSYTTSFYKGVETFEGSFDLSKSQNLQEVDIGVHWMGGRLLWIPTALSTLRRATSPHLSAIKLHFTQSPTVKVETLTGLEDINNDLGWAADEFARIEREFEVAVNLTVLQDLGFRVMFNALNIFQHYHR